ncbi:hypothetical protein HGRIS_000039 [Hohenbuehelia grisea]|uniref:Uncharacterized protein n=1 Tax=Hohenbuehelia grisea TaxID=104357 RepID=A0ABR3JQY0_9AGAR
MSTVVDNLLNIAIHKHNTTMDAVLYDVDAKAVKVMVDLYHQYVKIPGDPKPLSKLINTLSKAINFLGGSWEYDSDKPIPSCFRGLTKVCWLLSGSKPGDGADAYRYFVNDNYNLWVQMDTGKKRDYQRSCHSITDGEGDWTKITRNDVAARQRICQAAVDVTSGMYGAGAPETVASEALWDKRQIS